MKAAEEEIIGLMKLTLEMRHICPTAPDTLRSYPFHEEDPFIIHECPNVYFTGNMDQYEERLVYSTVNIASKQAVKLISVPTFRKSKSIVLLDLGTLQSYEVKFDLSEGIMPVRDSAMDEKMLIDS